MDTLTRPACPAQYTDELNTWACSGRHLGDAHAVVVDGVVVRLWFDPDHQATDGDEGRYSDLVDAVEQLVAAVRGRACDPRVRAVITAYDALTNPGAVAS